MTCNALSSTASGPSSPKKVCTSVDDGPARDAEAPGLLMSTRMDDWTGIAPGIAPGPLSLTAANSKALTEEEKRLGSERQLDKTPHSRKASVSSAVCGSWHHESWTSLVGD